MALRCKIAEFLKTSLEPLLWNRNYATGGAAGSSPDKGKGTEEREELAPVTKNYGEYAKEEGFFIKKEKEQIEKLKQELKSGKDINLKKEDDNKLCRCQVCHKLQNAKCIRNRRKLIETPKALSQTKVQNNKQEKMALRCKVTEMLKTSFEPLMKNRRYTTEGAAGSGPDKAKEGEDPEKELGPVIRRHGGNPNEEGFFLKKDKEQIDNLKKDLKDKDIKQKKDDA